MDLLRTHLDDFQEKQKITKLVEDATSECLMKPSEKYNSLLCAHATGRGDLLLSALRKRVEHSNPAVQYMALKVLEHCIQNANSTFHDDLAADAKMQNLLVKAALCHAAHPTVVQVKELAARIALDLSRTFEHDEGLHALASMHREISNCAPPQMMTQMTPPRQQPQLQQVGPAPPQPPPQQNSSQMIEMECGFCDVRLSFPANARKVKCGNCQQVNRVTQTVQCGACNTLNEVMLSLESFACGHCGTPNQVSQPPATGPASEPWSCPQCTFVNPATRQFQCSQCPFLRRPAQPPQPAIAPPPAPVEPWQCGTCTFMCTRNKTTCEMCGALKTAPLPPPPVVVSPPAPVMGTFVSAPPPPPSAASGPWTCGGCTFVNTGAYATCDMCTAPRPPGGASSAPRPLIPSVPPSSAPAPALPWVCGVCTFANSGSGPGSGFCEMCASARQ